MVTFTSLCGVRRQKFKFQRPTSQPFHLVRLFVFVTVLPDTEYGLHGYDNNVASMRPIFLANGPRFKRGAVVDQEFRNVDLFNLFCRMLGIAGIDIDGDDPVKIWNAMLKTPM